MSLVDNFLNSIVGAVRKSEEVEASLEGSSRVAGFRARPSAGGSTVRVGRSPRDHVRLGGGHSEQRNRKRAFQPERGAKRGAMRGTLRFAVLVPDATLRLVQTPGGYRGPLEGSRADEGYKSERRKVVHLSSPSTPSDTPFSSFHDAAFSFSSSRIERPSRSACPQHGD